MEMIHNLFYRLKDANRALYFGIKNEFDRNIDVGIANGLEITLQIKAMNRSLREQFFRYLADNVSRSVKNEQYEIAAIHHGDLKYFQHIFLEDSTFRNYDPIRRCFRHKKQAKASRKG